MTLCEIEFDTTALGHKEPNKEGNIDRKINIVVNSFSYKLLLFSIIYFIIPWSSWLASIVIDPEFRPLTLFIMKWNITAYY